MSGLVCQSVDRQFHLDAPVRRLLASRTALAVDKSVAPERKHGLNPRSLVTPHYSTQSNAPSPPRSVRPLLDDVSHREHVHSAAAATDGKRGHRHLSSLQPLPSHFRTRRAKSLAVRCSRLERYSLHGDGRMFSGAIPPQPPPLPTTTTILLLLLSLLALSRTA